MEVRCHICNIDVASTHIARHQYTELHNLNLKLINEAVDRLKKHVNETTVLPRIRIKPKKEFCDVCSCACEEDTSHELSVRHLNSSHYIKQLKDYAKLYFTPPNDFSVIQFVNPELTKIQKYINDVSEKFSIKHLKAFDEDHLEITAVNCKRLKLGFDEFHTLSGKVYINCQLCHKVVSDNHKMAHIHSDEHIDKIKNPFPDENCITQRDRMGFCFCLLCSKYLFYVDVYQHITYDQEHKVNVKNAMISEQNDNSLRNSSDNLFISTKYENRTSIKDLASPKKAIIGMEFIKSPIISNTLTNRKVLIHAELEHKVPYAISKINKALTNQNKLNDAIPTQDINLIDLNEGIAENKIYLEKKSQTSINKRNLIEIQSNIKFDEIPFAAFETTKILTNQNTLNNAVPTQDLIVKGMTIQDITDKAMASQNILNEAVPAKDIDPSNKEMTEDKIDIELAQSLESNNTLTNRIFLENHKNIYFENEIPFATVKTSKILTNQNTHDIAVPTQDLTDKGMTNQNVLNEAVPGQDHDLTNEGMNDDKIAIELVQSLVSIDTLTNRNLLENQKKIKLENEIPFANVKTTKILTNQNASDDAVPTQDLTDNGIVNQNILNTTALAQDSDLINEEMTEDKLDVELAKSLISNNTLTNTNLLVNENNTDLEKEKTCRISETTNETTLNDAIPSQDSDIIDEGMTGKTLETESITCNVITYNKVPVDQNDAEIQMEAALATVSDTAITLKEQSILNDDLKINIPDNLNNFENKAAIFNYESIDEEIAKNQYDLAPFDESDQITIPLRESENTMSVCDNKQPSLEDTKQMFDKYEYISEKKLSLATRLINMQSIEGDNNSNFIKPIKIQTIESNNTLNHVLQSGYNSKVLSCRVCLTKLPKNVNVVNDHLNSIRHTINYKTLLLNNKLVLENNKTFCQACDNWMYMGDIFDHINSENHLNKIHPDKLFAEKENVYEDGTICSVCDTDVSGASVDAHESGRRHQTMIKEMAAANKLRALCQSLNALDEPEHEEIEALNERAEFDNYIDLITREYPADHKINVLNHVYLEIIATNGDKIILSKDQFHTFNVSATMAGCYLCGILLNGPEKIKLHINSEAHKQNAMVDFEDRHCIRRREGTSFSFPYYCLLCQGSVHHLSIDIHKKSIEHLQKVDKVIFSTIVENVPSNSSIAEPAVKLVCHPANSVERPSTSKQASQRAKEKPSTSKQVSQGAIEKPSTSKQVSQGAIEKPSTSKQVSQGAIEKPSTSKQVSQGAIKKSVVHLDNKSKPDQKLLVNTHRADDEVAATKKVAITQTYINDGTSYDNVAAAKHKVAPASGVNNKDNAIKKVAAGNVAVKNDKATTANNKATATVTNVDKLNYQLAPMEKPHTVLCRICKVPIPNNEHNITTHLQGQRHAMERQEFFKKHKIVDHGKHFLCNKCEYYVLIEKLFNHIRSHRNV